MLGIQKQLYLFMGLLFIAPFFSELSAQKRKSKKEDSAQVQKEEFKTNSAWTPDKAHSKFQFRATHLGLTEITGHFEDYDIDFALGEQDDFATASFRARIHTASLYSGIEERDYHLKGKDFFEVEKYPYMYFESKNISPKPGGKANEYQAEGILTVKGIAKPLTIVMRVGKPVIDPKGDYRVGFAAFGIISRRNFGMDFDIPLQDPDVEFISEDIRLDIGVELIRTAQ